MSNLWTIVADEWRRLQSEHPELEGIYLEKNDRLSRTLARCHHKRKWGDTLAGGYTTYAFKIDFNSKLFEGDDSPEVRAALLDTVRHEAAHALAGYGAGHGPRWKAQARRLGARPVSCCEVPACIRQKIMESARYLVECDKCGVQDYRTRLTQGQKNMMDAGQSRHANGGCGGMLFYVDTKEGI